MKLRFEKPAEEALERIMKTKKQLGYDMLARLEVLKTEPYPHFFGDYTINSQAVQILIKDGFDIRTLKCSEFHRYRIFYFVDEGNDIVVVCEIVMRKTDKITYGKKAAHIERIKAAYKRHFAI